jgi:hypothetical protein
VIAFGLLERKQHNLQRAYSNRSISIELLAKARGRRLFPHYSKGPWSLGNAIDLVARNERFLVRHSEIVFYVFVLLAVGVFTVLQISISKKIERGDFASSATQSGSWPGALDGGISNEP